MALAALVVLPSVHAAAATHVVINEVELGPPGTGSPWAELYNPLAVPVDIGGWAMDRGFGQPIALPAGTALPPHGFLVVDLQGPSQRAGPLHLLDANRTTVDGVPPIADGAADVRTWARHPDGEETGTLADWSFGPGTPGASNGPPPEGGAPTPPSPTPVPPPSPPPGDPRGKPPVLSVPRADPNEAVVGSQVNLMVAVVSDGNITIVAAEVSGPGMAASATVNMTDTDEDGVYSVAWGTSGLSPGTYSVDFWAVDDRGNAARLPHALVVTLRAPAVDRQPPVLVAADTRPARGPAGTNFTVLARLQDASGVASVVLLVLDPEGRAVSSVAMRPTGVQGEYSATWDSAGFGPGNYTPAVEASDALGNAGPPRSIGTLNLQVPPPAAEVLPRVVATSTTPARPRPGEPVVVTTKAQGPVVAAQVEFRVNGSHWESMPMVPQGDHWVAQLPPQPPGIQVDYVVVVQDGHGNEGRTPMRAMFILPQDAPVVRPLPYLLPPALYFLGNALLATYLFFRGQGWRRPMAGWMFLTLFLSVLGLALWRLFGRRDPARRVCR